MRLKTLLCILTCFALIVVKANSGFALKTVVIDAGHGGKDPGAIGPGKTNEKDVALAVALKLGEFIKKSYPDVNIIYTRDHDEFVELHERAEIANKSKADMFIAVHCNSSTNALVYGSSSYVLGLHKTEANLEVAKRENAVILLEDNRDKHYEFDPNSPEGHIIMSMKQNAFLDQSISLAQKVENFLESYGKRKSLGVKQAGFYVLYKTTMPSILAEIGFISNPDEEKFLASLKGQEQIANSLFRAFSEYKVELENSEGEQFAYEQAQNEAKGVKDTTKAEPAATNTSNSGWYTTENKVTSDPPSPAPKATTTTENKKATTETKPVTNDTKPATTETKPNKTTTTTEQPTKSDDNYITVSGGKKIRKPVEMGSGGGAAAKTTEAPIAKTDTKTTTETKPVTETKKTTTETKPSVTETKKTTTETPTTKEPTAEKKEPKPEVKPEPKTTTTEKKTTTTVTKEPSTTATTTKPETKKPGTTTAKSSSGSTFKIQICALKGPLKGRDKYENLFGEISTEALPSGLTRYYAGNADSYSAAEKLLTTIHNNGFATAFIVGFKNGQRMTPQEMKAFGQ